MPFENNIPYTTLKTILIVIGTLGMMYSTTKFKYSIKRIALIIFLFLCYVAASSAVITTLFGYTFYLSTVLFTVSAPGVYLFFRFADDKASKSVFNHATQILFSLYVTVSVTLINIRIQGTELTEFLLHLVAYSIIILLEYRFLRKPFLRLASITQKGWLTLALIPCSLLVISIVLATYPTSFARNPTGVIFVYLLGIVIVIIYFAVFEFLFMQYRFQTTKQDLEILKIQNKNLQEKIARDAAATEQSLIDKHDTRHRYQTIISLLEGGQTSEAISYIAQFVGQLEAETSTVYCKDVLLNATLSSYFGQTKKAGITLETRLSLPDTLPVDSGEFSIVVANALENAIKACCLLPEEDRRIVFQCIYKPKLMLKISNPCKKEIDFSEDGVPLSDEKEHGFGTRSIIAFCKKYGALCSFTAEDGWFRLKIVL